MIFGHSNFRRFFFTFRFWRFFLTILIFDSFFQYFNYWRSFQSTIYTEFFKISIFDDFFQHFNFRQFFSTFQFFTIFKLLDQFGQAGDDWWASHQQRSQNVDFQATRKLELSHQQCQSYRHQCHQHWLAYHWRGEKTYHFGRYLANHCHLPLWSHESSVLSGSYFSS